MTEGNQYEITRIDEPSKHGPQVWTFHLDRALPDGKRTITTEQPPGAGVTVGSVMTWTPEQKQRGPKKKAGPKR